MEIPPHLVDLLRKAKRVTVLTGAGVSAESGVPTFRDALTGLWTQYRPEDLATPQAFLKDPQKVWEWYTSRRERLSLAQPNPGHRALAEMEGHIPEFTLITQNVDGLHRRADSRNVIELHGNLGRVKCFDEGIVVEPAASLPYWASERGAVIVEVNPEHTPLTAHADFALHGPSGEVLPELVKRTWDTISSSPKS